MYYSITNTWYCISYSEDPSWQFYQLTLSDNLWLKNARDFGQSCIGIDGKYDLNINHAPALSIVAKNKVGFATPIAFGIKLNNYIYNKILS